MGFLSDILGGTPPPNTNTTIQASNGLPEWYQQYLQGIAGQATSLAGQAQNTPLPAQSVAGFTPDQLQAFQQVRENQGAWKPLVNDAAGVAGQIAPGVQGMVGQAQQAVAGPASQFPTQFQQYMSPYTQGVVDNIARLGVRNFNENIMPGINGSMIGSGQFGSTRNADILGRAGRDVQADITGQQSQALQAGYGMSADIFAQDANRAQQQQQMQGSAALGGAGALSTGLSTAAGTLGGLGQSYSALGLGDAQTLGAVGQQQQGLTQAGYDTNYTNATNAIQQPWTNLGNLNSVVRGMQLPAAPGQVTNAPVAGAGYTIGPLGQLGQAYGAVRTATS